jgi:DNA-binding transcriptional LysR family regulator
MSTVTLDQWQSLICVVDEGGYAAAAEAMGKSQSAVSYAVQKLEANLDAKVFTLEGRRSVLTPVGKTLYKRAKQLLDDANHLEDAGRKLSRGDEAIVRIAVDTLFPIERLLQCIDAAHKRFTATQFEILELTLSGPNEALLQGKAEIAITGFDPPGMPIRHVATVTLLTVAAINHPLQQLQQPLTKADLKKHRQIVVKDSGQKTNRDAGWLGAEQRITVNNGYTAAAVVRNGMGFASAPIQLIQADIDAGLVKPLVLSDGGSREVRLSLVLADPDYAGPATRFVANELLKPLS